MSEAGSLVCVGIGMTLGLSPRAALQKLYRKSDVVCAAGVSAWPSHKAAVQPARREGYRAHMEPGTLAEDCLFADLGIDPGQAGCQYWLQRFRHGNPLSRVCHLPLPDAEVDIHMTAVILPATAMQPNPEVRKQLAAIQPS